MRVCTFHDELNMSQGFSVDADVREILLREIPGAVDVEQADYADDFCGVDWWVSMPRGDKLGVDCKVRRQDFALRGEDDLALELWSVVEGKIPGWSVDKKKRTDYILWLWRETGRWCLVPFRMLLAVSLENREKWASTYKTRRQLTLNHPRHGDYHSECVFVPRREVWGAIYRKFAG